MVGDRRSRAHRNCALAERRYRDRRWHHVAIGSSGVILASSDPPLCLSTSFFSQVVLPKDVRKPWWSAGYNLISVPLRPGCWRPIGS